MSKIFQDSVGHLRPGVSGLCSCGRPDWCSDNRLCHSFWQGSISASHWQNALVWHPGVYTCVDIQLPQWQKPDSGGRWLNVSSSPSHIWDSTGIGPWTNPVPLLHQLLANTGHITMSSFCRWQYPLQRHQDHRGCSSSPSRPRSSGKMGRMMGYAVYSHKCTLNRITWKKKKHP